MIKDNQDSMTQDPLDEQSNIDDLINAPYPEHWVRKTVLFLLSQSFSLFGSSLVQFAIIWHITLTTQSGVMMTISTVFAFLPQLVISLFAGVWADRYNRKTLMILSDFLIASATLVLAVMFYMGYGSLWALFIASGIRSLGAGIQTPAVNAFLPQIVPKAKLMKVNGINNSIGSMILLIAPIISGVLLTSSTLEVTFFIDVITAMFAILILFFLKVPAHEKALSIQQEGYFDDLKAGLLYVRDNRFIKDMLIFYAVFFFLLVPVAFLTPLMVARSFGDDVWRLTANEVVFFLGSILGGILISIWKGLENHIHTIAISCSLLGIFTLGLGLSKYFSIYLFFMFLSGLIVPFFVAAITTLLQERIDNNMQGRIFGLTQIVMAGVMPLGMVIVGPIADLVAIEILFVITGFLMALLGIKVYFNKSSQA